MNPVLVTATVVALLAAVVGGGLKAFDIELPVVSSRRARLGLALLGVLFGVGAIAFREDKNPPPKDPAVAAYREQALATCKSVNRVAKRNTAGLPDDEGRFNKEAILASARDNYEAIERRLRVMAAKTPPDALRNGAQQLPAQVDAFLRVHRRILKEFGDRLPERPTLEELTAAAEPFQGRSDAATANLERALSDAAQRECTLT